MIIVLVIESDGEKENILVNTDQVAWIAKCDDGSAVKFVGDEEPIIVVDKLEAIAHQITNTGR